METRKKILFINNTSRLGAGTSQSLLLLLKYLSPHYNVSVVSDRRSEDLPGALSELGIPHFAYRDRTLFFLPQLIMHILTNKIDLVYGNNLSGRTRVAFWAARFTRRPYIWHIRESVRENDQRVKEIHRANAVIANSEDTAERLRKNSDVKTPVIIPNGVEIEAYVLERDSCRKQLIKKLGCASDSIFVINLGRICEQKNQPDVVKVGINVLKSFPQTHFLFLGELQDSDYIQQMNQEINKSEYQDHFHILGHINDFIPYLVGSDILLHTARWEPQGRVILEAMASRLPVVAYDVGGVGEAVVQGETGFLRPFGDIDGLTADLEQLLRKPSLRNNFGEAGYFLVQSRFNAKVAGEKIKTVIGEILNLPHVGRIN